MKYVKIKAKNYNEAMLQLKMNYGDEAIPISHKYLREGGFLKTKFFAREVVELMAAVREKSLSESINFDFEKQSDIWSEKLEQIGKEEDPLAKEDRDDSFFQEDLSEEKKDNSSQKVLNSTDEVLLEDDFSVSPKADLEKEFSEIKEKLDQLLIQKKNLESTSLSSKGDFLEDKNWELFREILENNDFSSLEARDFLQDLKKKLASDELNDPYKIEKSFKDLLKSKIVTTGPFQKGSVKKIIMFIGPTGVGKTTTMAKLGAKFSLQDGYKTAFITIDNYRIAATEQLKKYAEIMNISAYAVNNTDDFKEIVGREEAEIILVDTSGRSHKNKLKISEIKNFSEQLESDFEKVLCVSANTKKKDLNSIFKAFDEMNFDSVIITKIDETSFVGNVIDVADKYQKPISYVTNGQEVPNDILEAEVNQLVDLMVGEF